MKFFLFGCCLQNQQAFIILSYFSWSEALTNKKLLLHWVLLGGLRRDIVSLGSQAQVLMDVIQLANLLAWHTA